MILCLVLVSIFSVNFASAAVQGHRGNILLREGISIDMVTLERFCSEDSCVIDESESYKSILFKISDESNRESGYSVNYNKIRGYYSIYIYDNSAESSNIFEYASEGLKLLSKYNILKGLTDKELEEIIGLIENRKTIYFKPESCVDSNSYVAINPERSGFPEEEINEIIESTTDEGESGWLSSGWGAEYGEEGCPVIEYQIGIAGIAGEEIQDLSSLTALNFEEESNNNYLLYSIIGILIIGLLIWYFVSKKK